MGPKPIQLQMKGLTALAIVVGIVFFLSVGLSYVSYGAEQCGGMLCRAEEVCNPVTETCEPKDDSGGGGGSPGSICDPVCDPAGGTRCIGNQCVPVFIPATLGRAQCVKDADCGDGWKCIKEWGVCVKPDEYIKSETAGWTDSVYTTRWDYDDGPYGHRDDWEDQYPALRNINGDCDNAGSQNDKCDSQCMQIVYIVADRPNPESTTHQLPLIDE